QTISTKYRHQQSTGTMPQNFLRHYYDVYCLLDDAGVQAFIGTKDYFAHKDRRFPAADEKDLTRNPAFLLEEAATREAYAKSYERTRALYYREQPSLEAILAKIGKDLKRL
ncbi:MAG: nucleotidyl transferase AbiEii/AbiGii toxin family protein, partial [Sphingosinicella sp.]